jgi:hypothetical protein
VELHKTAPFCDINGTVGTVDRSDVMSEWVSCAERMPDVGSRVLAFWPDAVNCMVREMRFDHVKRLQQPVWIWAGRRADKHRITHWMPLPEPPKDAAGVK